MVLRTLLTCLLSVPALATELRVCSDNRNVPPLIYVDGMGAAQYILPRVAANLGLDLSIVYHPQPRCLLEVDQGHFDAVLVAAPNPITLNTLAFPITKDGQFDRNRAYLDMTVVAFRLKTSQAQWDGKHFSNLDKQVLYEVGVPSIHSLMQEIDVPSKASARTPVHMINMMRLQRADIGIGLGPAVAYALHVEDPDAEFEIIQPPLLQTTAYLGLGKTFQAANPELSERLWDEIRRFIASPQWQAVAEQVQNNHLPPEGSPAVPVQPPRNSE